MLHVVSYDIADDGRRRKAAETLKDYGERVQYSVFECGLDGAGLEEMMGRLKAVIEEAEDSCRVYRLCGACEGEVWIVGKGERYEKEKTVII
ncbi:MAG: CRISPR-associated endonuclease Cas2 [Acidobacteria bacterium]|nr:CRISPR-associated endonuclease Cas2 [Acidobacteriota bacterium]